MKIFSIFAAELILRKVSSKLAVAAFFVPIHIISSINCYLSSNSRIADTLNTFVGLESNSFFNFNTL